MRNLWLRYSERIDALSLRERVLVFAAAVAVLLAPVYVFLIEEQSKAEQRLSDGIARRQAELKTLESQLTKLATTRAADPDRPLRERLAEVRRQLAETEAAIAQEERKFTAPAQMKAVIAEMLARNPRVQLVALRSVPTTTIAEARTVEQRGGAQPAAANPGAAPAGERLVYRHGLEVTVNGAYLDLLAYLRDLERLPTQLYWGALALDASRYPRHSMKLVVYTLSLDPTWLNV